MTRIVGHERGFTYIGLLIAVAVMTVGFGAAGQVWHTIVQRANEAQLVFVGGQFKQALERYYENSPGGAQRFPQSLDELLRDTRYPTTVRYLRRIYPDPMTGLAQWGLVRQGDRIIGVYSLSEKAPFRSRGSRAGSERTKYSDWMFLAEVVPNSAAPVTQAAPAAGASPTDASR